ncbi:MAG: site-specific integrase [Oscillospiraceae bacterium]|nr:site-specific integrase [Oscillospiraceae bacterium]
MATSQKLPSGNWRAQFFIVDKDGTRKRKSVTAPTRWEAEKMAAEYAQNAERVRNLFTVAAALTGYIDLKRNVLSPSTIRGYEVIRDHRLQSIMNLDIHELTSFEMQRAINEDAATKGRKTISEAMNLVVTALKLYGVRLELNVTLPPKKPKIKELPTVEQVINMIRGTDIELPCMLAIWLSLRVSEVRGLQFRDLKDGVLTICRSKMYLDGKDVLRDVNKTYKSTRRLAVPAYLNDLIQRVPHNSDEDYIVPVHYQFIRKHLKKLAKANGFTMTFHDLRHLNASVMLFLNIPDKYAMERGGWSTSSTLKNVYQHTFSEERKQVDKKIDDYFNGILRV